MARRVGRAGEPDLGWRALLLFMVGSLRGRLAIQSNGAAGNQIDSGSSSQIIRAGL